MLLSVIPQSFRDWNTVSGAMEIRSGNRGYLPESSAARYHLIPYYYDLFFTGEKTGLPIMRSLVLHYEKDEVAKECNAEFLAGPNLLAAPVVTQGDRKKMVYLLQELV